MAVLDFDNEGYTSQEGYHKAMSNTISASMDWYRKQENGPKDWKLYDDFYKGNHYEFKDLELAKTETPNPNTTVNFIGSDIERYLALFTRRDVYLIVEPTLPEYTSSSKVAQHTLNYFWNEVKAEVPYRRVALDCLKFGTGVARVGWQLEEAQSKNKKKLGKIMTPEDIKIDSPFIRRIRPHNFVFDPEAPDHSLNTARYAFEIYYMPAYELVSNLKFDQSVIKKITRGDYRLKEYNTAYWTDTLSPDFKDLDPYDHSAMSYARVECYDFWDKRFETHSIYVKGVPEPIFTEDWPHDYLDGYPFATVGFIPDNDSHFPIGYVRWLIDNQVQQNRSRSQMFEWAKRCANQMFWMDTSKVDTESDVNEYVKNRMGQVILSKNGEPGGALQVPPMPPSLIQLDAILDGDRKGIGGLSGAERGESVEPRVPAAGINQQAQFINIKIKDKMAMMDEFIVEVSKQWLQHMKTHMTKPRAVKIAGPEGFAWLMQTNQTGLLEPMRVTNEDIKGDFDIKIRPTELPEIDPLTKQRNILSWYQQEMSSLPMVSQIQPEAIPDILELKRMVAEEMQFKDVSRLYPGIARPIQPTLPNEPPQGAREGGEGAPQPQLTQQAFEQGVQPQSEVQGVSGDLSGGLGY